MNSKIALSRFSLGPSNVGKTVREFRDFRAKERISSWSKIASSDRIILLLLVIWFLPIVLAAAFAVVRFVHLPYLIPLFYSRSWGDDQLAKNFYIFLPLGGALFLGIFNFGMALSFYDKDKVISYILAGAAALVAVLSVITTVNITNLVG